MLTKINYLKFKSKRNLLRIFDLQANRNVDNKLNDLCRQINDIKRMITDEIDERSKMIQLQKDEYVLPITRFFVRL